ncbi:hypothetical protein [Paraburkholderia tropica]|uniref:hypothetical protein n=1 Tax=Paraburkholderia tropica TaxID=92647 RepID=UPI00158FCAF8|nr:hypothetical protein [Paraburkholderia tropica]
MRLKLKGLRPFESQLRTGEIAREVNLVWNFCNELSLKVWQPEQRFLAGYNFHPFTNGSSKAGLGLRSQTIQAIGEEYAVRRKQACKVKLPWRLSSPA